MKKPDFIRHFLEIQEDDEPGYPGSTELLSIGSPFSKAMGLKHIAVHHELLPPGRRTSWPHAHSQSEEFVYVIEGTPDVWIDGELHRLKPGDGIAFPHGTGISHTFLNNTEQDVRLLVVGEPHSRSSRVYYPLHPGRKRDLRREEWWNEVPRHKRGEHDGLPDAARS